MSAPTRQPARFRDEVRTSATLAAPLVVGHLSTGLIGFVDAVLAGHHGTTTLAAVSVGTALFWLPMMIPMGTLMALPPGAVPGRHRDKVPMVVAAVRAQSSPRSRSAQAAPSRPGTCTAFVQDPTHPPPMARTAIVTALP